MPIEIEMLRKISYFSALNMDDLTQVAMLTVERHFIRGELILIAGETEGSLRLTTRICPIARPTRRALLNLVCWI
jgi:hypothetical protein